MENLEELKKQKLEIQKQIQELDQKRKRETKSCVKKSNIITRVSTSFNEDLEEIQVDRVNKDMEEFPISKPKITDLIVKHKSWGQMKEDCKNFLFVPKNKKGQFTALMFLGIMLVLFLVIYFLVFGTTILKIDEQFDQNISIGQVNLAEVNAVTFGVFADSLRNNADWWGLGTIFGMIFGLLLSAYFLRNKFPKISLIIDIFIIIAVFVFSLYMRSIYLTLMESLASAGEAFLELYMPNTSKFLLNLPIFVSIIGVLMMVINHSSIPARKEETGQTRGGFQAIGG